MPIECKINRRYQKRAMSFTGDYKVRSIDAKDGIAQTVIENRSWLARSYPAVAVVRDKLPDPIRRSYFPLFYYFLFASFIAAATTLR